MSAVRYDVLVSGLTPVRDAPLPDGSAPHWSRLSHTLVYGPKTAALIDPPITREQTDALADWIAAHGRTLGFIYITHWHGDHWLGAARLLRRFPEAVVLAGPGTVERIRQSTAGGTISGPWNVLFPGQLDEQSAAIPVTQVTQVASGGFTVDGHQLVSIEVGHSDTDDSTVLHVPEIGLIVAGDVVYNNVHQYVAESPGGGLESWHAALDAVAALAPRIVVAGHKDARRADAPSDIDETRRYLDSTARVLAAQPTRREFVDRMLRDHPDRVNPYTVWLSARRLIREEA